MNIKDLAKKDWHKITSNKSGFGYDISITTPDGLKNSLIVGTTSKHHIGFDTDGALVNVKNAQISFSEQQLTDDSYPVRNLNNEVQLRGHIVVTKDSTGIDKEYIITENFADETIGMIVCILGDYSATGEENQPSYLFKCADSTVVNSDSTFTYDIESSATYILPDSVISNSDNTFTENLPSTNNLVLSDETIQVTNYLGEVLSTVQNPYLQDITIEVPIAQAPLVVNEWFEIEVDTRISGTSPSDSFYLRLTQGSITVDWESNGVLEYITDITGLSDSRLTHKYTLEGIYTVRIKGYGTIIYSHQPEKTKVLNLSNFGSFKHISGLQSFAGCQNATCTATDILIVSNNTMFQYFYGMSFEIMPKVQFASISNLGYFIAENSLFNDNLGGMDLRSVTTMDSFALNVTTWSTPNYNASLMGFLRMQSGDTTPPTGWVLQSNVPFHGGSSVATGDGLVARNYLINVLNWTITDSTP